VPKPSGAFTATTFWPQAPQRHEPTNWVRGTYQPSGPNPPEPVELARVDRASPIVRADAQDRLLDVCELGVGVEHPVEAGECCESEAQETTPRALDNDRGQQTIGVLWGVRVAPRLSKIGQPLIMEG
jgi:hypothetical protein